MLCCWAEVERFLGSSAYDQNMKLKRRSLFKMIAGVVTAGTVVAASPALAVAGSGLHADRALKPPPPPRTTEDWKVGPHSPMVKDVVRHAMILIGVMCVYDEASASEYAFGRIRLNLLLMERGMKAPLEALTDQVPAPLSRLRSLSDSLAEDLARVYGIKLHG